MEPDLILFVLVLVLVLVLEKRKFVRRLFDTLEDENEDDDEDDWNQPVTRIRPIRSFQSKIRNPKSAIEGP